MRLSLLFFTILLLTSCASGSGYLNYDYLPKSKYKYYKPNNSQDLKQSKFSLHFIDNRASDLISCSEITLPRDSDLEGEAGFSYFKNYLRAMIEESNGVLDQDSGKEITVELTGISSESYGFMVVKLFALVEFKAKVDGEEKTYCSEMVDDDEDSPIGPLIWTETSALRSLVSGSVRRVFEEFVQDLSAATD